MSSERDDYNQSLFDDNNAQNEKLKYEDKKSSNSHEEYDEDEFIESVHKNSPKSIPNESKTKLPKVNECVKCELKSLESKKSPKSDICHREIATWELNQADANNPSSKESNVNKWLERDNSEDQYRDNEDARKESDIIQDEENRQVHSMYADFKEQVKDEQQDYYDFNQSDIDGYQDGEMGIEDERDIEPQDDQANIHIDHLRHLHKTDIHEKESLYSDDGVRNDEQYYVDEVNEKDSKESKYDNVISQKQDDKENSRIIENDSKASSKVNLDNKDPVINDQYVSDKSSKNSEIEQKNHEKSLSEDSNKDEDYFNTLDNVSSSSEAEGESPSGSSSMNWQLVNNPSSAIPLNPLAQQIPSQPHSAKNSEFSLRSNNIDLTVEKPKIEDIVDEEEFEVDVSRHYTQEEDIQHDLPGNQEYEEHHTYLEQSQREDNKEAEDDKDNTKILDTEDNEIVSSKQEQSSFAATKVAEVQRISQKSFVSLSKKWDEEKGSENHNLWSSPIIQTEQSKRDLQNIEDSDKYSIIDFQNNGTSNKKSVKENPSQYDSSNQQEEGMKESQKNQEKIEEQINPISIFENNEFTDDADDLLQKANVILNNQDLSKSNDKKLKEIDQLISDLEEYNVGYFLTIFRDLSNAGLKIVTDYNPLILSTGGVM